jgi:UDP-glucose 4-epimerase
VGGRWLVTGGAGYIGAHVVRALLASGREAVVVDDFSTGLRARLPDEVPVLRADVTEVDAMTQVLRQTQPTGVVHVAGKKSPTESVLDPLLYARENVAGVTALLTAMRATGGSRVLFSSSCAVYGTPASATVGEDDPKLPESPYGDSKWYGERLLAAAARAYGLGVISLRYFNVVGAAEPGLADTGTHNLVPLVLRALRDGVSPQVFGTDYPTPDGTCVRDYVDVEDLADAHVRAVEALEDGARSAAYNVGRGEGASVLTVLDLLRSTTGHDFAHQVRPRRPGDPAWVVGRVDRIAADLGWVARRDLASTIGSAWRAERAR